MAKEGNEESSNQQDEESRRLSERLLQSLKNGFGVVIKGVGPISIKGGELKNIEARPCWAYFTHNGERFRTETNADKLKLMAGDGSAVCVAMDPPKPAVIIEEEPAPRKGPFQPRWRGVSASAIAAANM